MNPRPWTSENRDALLSRVTVLTAGTAVVGAVGAGVLGVGLAAGTHYKTAAVKTPVSATQAQSESDDGPVVVAPRVVAPDKVQVQVLNGTGIPGAAHAVASQLSAAGFDVVGIGNAPSSPVGATSIVYPPEQAGALRTLVASTGVSASSASGTGEVLVLTVGPDWAGALPARTTTKPRATYNPPVAPVSGNGNANNATSGGS